MVRSVLYSYTATLRDSPEKAAQCYCPFDDSAHSRLFLPVHSCFTLPLFSRIVTIGPLVLLSLMGVTFFLGLRLTRRPLEKEWTTSNYRIKPTTKIIFSSQEAEHTPRTSMSRNIPSTWRESPVSDVEVSLREGEGRGVRSASARAKSKTVKTDKRRAERYSGCEEMAPGQRGPTRIVPRRSLRNLLQEGPEDGSDPEQVGMNEVYMSNIAPPLTLYLCFS